MNEDYLWDKTGEPDPEIQKLEEILGALRYQTKPLELPEELAAPRQRRNHLPLLAIAASVLLALIAAGFWLRVHLRSDSSTQQASVETGTPSSGERPETPKSPVNKSAVNPTLLTAKKSYRKRSASSALPKYEREEALAAKQQVMLALRLTTEKLSLVQKKTQNPNQIKNQHRVG